MTDPTPTAPQDALMPCPFCGEKAAKIHSARSGEDSVDTWFRCESCGATYSDPGWAKFLWNTRAPTTQASAGTEEVLRFNVNDFVRVRVTDAGRKAYREYHDQLGLNPDDYQLKADPDGWVKMQLWEVMQYFGHATYNGCDVPFDTEMDIEITDEALERVAKAMISEHNWHTGTDSNRFLALIQARRAWEKIEKIRNEDGKH